MYPSWGGFGGQNYGGSGPRKQSGAGHSEQTSGFDGFEASPSGSLFSSLQEQHRQQMQQLQMMHQKQLQTVLHHGNHANSYGPGHSGGYPGPSWHSELQGQSDGGTGAHSYYKQDEQGPQQGQRQPPPPPPQPTDPQPCPPPPPEPQSVKPPDSNSGPKEAAKNQPSMTEDEKSRSLQEQQQLWYKKHLENLQKLKQEKSKQNKKGGDDSVPPPPPQEQGAPPPLPPSEPPKGMPPPPPPKEEPPAPPPPPEELQKENVEKPTFTDTPKAPPDPEEAARLQQLQAAAAQWQQVQQQRANLQYQVLMQHHEKLQQILEKYQQLIQQPTDLQSMSAEMQLRHYEKQQQQFILLFQEWNCSFVLWHEQFQTYHHKDQLQDYELQWKQWQEQMNATNAHLQERVATLTAMVPFASSQYSGGMMGQYGQYPGQDMQMQQQSVRPDMQHSPVAIGPRSQGPRPAGFGPHSESPAGHPVRGAGPRTQVPPTIQPQSFNNIRGPRGNNPRFDQPQQGFNGPPRFGQPRQRFDGPPRFELPQQRFDGPPRFEQPQQRFDGPPRFDQPQQLSDGPPMFEQPPQRSDGPPMFEQPQQCSDGPPKFEQPQQRSDGPPKFEQPQQRFDGPPRFEQPRQRFDGPPRFEQPRQRFDGPPRFEQPQHHGPPRFDQPRPRFDGSTRFEHPRPRFDGPHRFDQPRFGQQPRFEQPPKHPGPPPLRFEHPPIPPQNQIQGPTPEAESTTKQPDSMDSKTTAKSTGEPLSDKGKCESEPDKETKAADMTDDNMLGADGFFVQNDPIPQTLRTDIKSEEPDGENTSNSGDKANSSETKPSETVPSQTSTTAAKNPIKPEGTLTNSKSPLASTHPAIQKESQSSEKMQSRPDPQRLPPVRARGHPPAPGRGRGRGQMALGEFGGSNTVLPGQNMGDTSYNYVPCEETGIPEGQEDYNWQDPSYEEYGSGQSEMPSEDMWVPEEHHFPVEEEYYEDEPVGGQSMGRGGPPLMRGGLPMGRGGPPMGRGGPPMGRGGPHFGQGVPPFGRGGPQGGRGGPPMGRGGPPMGRGGPPMGRGGPPMGRGGPPMGRGGPPPIGHGGPHSMGRGESIDRHWEETGSFEYPEEGDPYCGDWGPPIRGKRPPFPPGRGRPPRGHPGLMHQGRGRPSHLAHGSMDHESLGHETNIEDPEMDPARHPMFHGREPHSHPIHPDVGRGRHRIPPSRHQMIDPMEERLYDEGLEGEMGWHSLRGRGRPPAPHEIMEAGGMRRRPMGRGRWPPGAIHEKYGEGYKEGFFEDYSHGEDVYRRRPPQDYPPEDYRDDAKYLESEWDREHPPERDYPPHMPPSDPYRDEHWLEERERKRTYLYDEYDRGRGDLRIREYRDEPPYPPSRSEWDRQEFNSRIPQPPERGFPADYEDRRVRYEEHREEPPLERIPPSSPVTKLLESTADSEPQGTNVLALSQHQHEIILKAAQELKLIREMKEGKTPAAEPQHAPTDTVPDLPAGLLGLEIPPDVRDVLKGMTAAGQTAASESLCLDTKPITPDYQSGLPVPPMSTVVPKTLDYGHGHEPGATVERISYGERIVLRPDPMPQDRGYDKEPLGVRDPYSRDPYYERRSDPFLDRREYSRERELYREKFPSEYERERYERERYPRERDDSIQSMVEERSPLGPSSRLGYRERDRDLREKERNSSRDRDEYYGRPGYDRPSYERIGPERYGHSSSPFVDRRSYPEERGPPPAAPPLPPPPQPPARVEKKPEIKNIDDILKPPGRSSRPERIVIIMRGLPGSGKSHVAKLIRDKEVDCGGAPPRVLVLDDYFMTEVEKVEKDPDTGRKIKTKVLEYEYEPEMEETYRNGMLKTFKKTLDDGFFPFIILDSINDKVKHFDQFWSAAKTKGFEVYVAEITADTQTCAKRNVHGRTHKDILKMSNNWESSPRHMMRLDVRSLLQDAAIEEVEMEDFNPDEEPKETKGEEEEESDLGYIPKSKWEMDTSEAKLDKLDGLGGGGKRKREDVAGLDDYLQLPDDYATRMSEPGKKRVRWADLEEQKDADRKRAIGFVVGQTDWARITDESGQLAQRALNRTKYF